MDTTDVLAVLADLMRLVLFNLGNLLLSSMNDNVTYYYIAVFSSTLISVVITKTSLLIAENDDNIIDTVT